MKNFLAARKFSKLLICNLLIVLLGLNLFGQSKSAYGTLSVNSDKNKTPDISRPRVITASKTVTLQSSENSVSDKAKSNLAPASAEAGKMERLIFETLNQKRIEKGLSPLSWSEDMAKVARQHSFNMAELKFFSHVGKDGLLVSDRADALGFSNWRAIGENIAYNQGFENPAEFACERWLLSPSHKNNILSREWKETGVGVAIAENGVYYFTQVFVYR